MSKATSQKRVASSSPGISAGEKAKLDRREAKKRKVQERAARDRRHRDAARYEHENM